LGSGFCGEAVALRWPPALSAAIEWRLKFWMYRLLGDFIEQMIGG
jgi:hypothetical protein